MPPPRGDIIPTTADEEFEDGRVRNAEAVTKIRDAWIYTQISARAKEFTQYRNVSSLLNRGRIFVVRFCRLHAYLDALDDRWRVYGVFSIDH
jgi:hypothetical protein